jgi:lysine 2,3-aminomutase
MTRYGELVQRAPFYRAVPEERWNDWHWQLRNRIYDYNTLCKVLEITDCNALCEVLEWNSEGKEIALVEQAIQKFPLAITPYTANEMWRHLHRGSFDWFKALALIYVATPLEPASFSPENIDGTGEDITSPAPRTHQFFPDRVLVRLNTMCPSLCRYCYVRRKVRAVGAHISRETVEEIVAYVKSNNNIRDVIISGGDPLLVSDDYLAWVLSRFRQIPHVDILRIDTKVPNSLPQRITDDLCHMLAEFHPLYMNIHITHPCELTDEMRVACKKLADKGVVLGAHIPLLRGINDSCEVIEELVVGLLKIRVRPYMLIHFITTEGAEHFRTPIKTGLEIMDYLLGRVSGLAMPMYVLYLPNGGGKVPLMPNYVVKHEGRKIYFRNYQGKIFEYEDRD